MTDKAIDRLYQEIAHLSEVARDQLWHHLVRGGISPLTMTPRMALSQARESGGKDYLREIASMSLDTALDYARYVDKGPHDVTREGPDASLNYAQNIDRGPHTVTRQGVLVDPFSALLYATKVDKGPRADTRQAACVDPRSAYKYATEVDNGPHDATRRSVIEGIPKGQWRDARFIARYALYVDRVARKDTWEVIQGTVFEQEYVDRLGRPVDQNANMVEV